jgi:endonuclease/exonuclease/phosphatase family metal-dependent hydrolase
LIQVVDRDVILARFDVHATPVDFTKYQPYGICLKPSDQGCNFHYALSVPILGGTINIERGFVAVDVSVHGKAYRFVTGHLEQKYGDSLATGVQVAQAAELLQILQATLPPHRSLLVVGDFNSSPADRPVFGDLNYPTPYMQFQAAGYTDAWTLRRGTLPGLTCCQLADLSNRKSVLYERIDMVFSLDAPAKVESAQVVGTSPLAKTPPFWRGLWPSDHGAVAAELEFR